MKTNLQQDLKQLRADLDVLLISANELRDSRETSTAYTKLQEAKMHVGNTLYEIGAATIYAESKNPENAKIDAYHIDYDITPVGIPADWNQNGLVENVKIMRRELDNYLVRAKSLLSMSGEMLVLGQEYFNPYVNLYITWAIVRLREAQNWYGAELGRLRDTQFHTVPV